MTNPQTTISKEVELDLRFQARRLVQYVNDILGNALIRPEERCASSETFLLGALADAYQRGSSDANIPDSQIAIATTGAGALII